MSEPKDQAGKSPGGRTTVVVTVKEEALGDMEAVQQELEDAGLEVDQVLGFIGQIVGKWSPEDPEHPEDMEPLRRVAGVADVEFSRAVQLPPPGSVTQ